MLKLMLDRGLTPSMTPGQQSSLRPFRRVNVDLLKRERVEGRHMEASGEV